MGGSEVFRDETLRCGRCSAVVPAASRFCMSCGSPVTIPPDAPAPEGDPEANLHRVRAALAPDFDVLAEVGHGGMAIVYRAVETELHRPVAIKVLPPDLVSTRAADRFRREARLAAGLDHPNIVPIHRVGHAGGVHFMSMKLVEGRSLDAVVQERGALPVPVVLEVLRSVAAALAYAHDRQIVHRDIKCANVLVDVAGRVVVTDFGIARALEEATLTATGSLLGTPAYMSPEQCAGVRVGPASDQYSLGIVAFHMLSGELPFAGESLPTVLQHHCFTPPPDLRGLRDDVPEALLAIVAQMLEKAPERRFPDAIALLEALDAVPQGPGERREAVALLRALARGADAGERVRTRSLPPLPNRTPAPDAAFATTAPPVVTAAPPPPVVSVVPVAPVAPPPPSAPDLSALASGMFAVPDDPVAPPGEAAGEALGELPGEPPREALDAPPDAPPGAPPSEALDVPPGELVDASSGAPPSAPGALGAAAWGRLRGHPLAAALGAAALLVAAYLGLASTRRAEPARVSASTGAVAPVARTAPPAASAAAPAAAPAGVIAAADSAAPAPPASGAAATTTRAAAPKDSGAKESAGPARAKVSPAAAYRRYQRSIFVVSGRESQARAFLVDTAGLVLTSSRTLREGGEVRVLVDPATRVSAPVVAVDTLNDLAVLAIPRARCAGCPALPLSSAMPRALDWVGVVTAPPAGSARPSLSLVRSADAWGTVSSIQLEPDEVGGPVLNEYGEVVGVATWRAGSRTDTTTSWSPSLVAIRRVLDRGRRALRSGAAVQARVLPAAPRDSFPARAVEEFASVRDPDLKPYLAERNGVQLFVMTPRVVGWRQARARLEAEKLKAKGAIASETDRVDPIQLWREWDEYVSSRRPVVVVAATPKDARFPLYDPRKNVKPKDGDVSDVRLLRDGQPVAPIDQGRFGATLRADSARLGGDPAARQALSVFNIDAFAPREDGSPPRVVVLVSNLAKGEDVSFTLDRRTVEQVLRDFQVYLLTRQR